MKTSWIVGIVVVLVIIFGGWYWFSQQPSAVTDNSVTNYSGAGQADNTGQMGTSGQTTTTTSTTTVTTSTPAGAILESATDAKLGAYLTATNGMTLYMYTKDTAGKSNCTGTCAANWQPYTVTSATGLVAAAGISGAVDTITRDDGTLQVTYKGHPLYFWKNDTKPGDTTGQNVGGVWFVVKP